MSFRLLARIVLPLLASAVFIGPARADEQLFRFTEAPGPHPVGLKVVEQYDHSRIFREAIDNLGRPYEGERARPLQTLIWYPAKDRESSPVTVRDYAELFASEITFGAPKLSANAQEWLEAMKPTLTMPLRAMRNAREAPGRFPVIIYAPSYSSMAWENADLCEYLASFGYVVLASPSMGAMTRAMTTDLAGIDAQARDISFLIGYAQTLPNTDTSMVGVAGFSWGGLSNLFAAARDNRIDALVALDGSLRYYPGLVQEARDVRPDEMTIPLLYFAQGSFTIEDGERFVKPEHSQGPSVLNAWNHGDLFIVYMHGLIHQEHSSMYQRNENMWKEFQRWQKAGYERSDGIVGYAWMSRYTRAFFDAYLKHDPDASGFLRKTPSQNGVPRHVLSMEYREGEGVPTNLAGFRSELGRRSFRRAPEVYEGFKKRNPGFTLPEQALSTWARELSSEGHFAEALALLKLNVQVHPDSASAYESLGDAYLKNGEEQLALYNYEQALTSNPRNESVKSKLQGLQSRRAAAR